MRYVAFLRGINVSGHNMVKMDVLKELFKTPGVSKVVTYIQSGNIVFDAKEADSDALRKRIEMLLLKGLGFQVPALVLRVSDIEQVIAKDPFSHLQDDERKRYVTFLEKTPEPALAKVLIEMCTGDEAMQIHGSILYFLTPAYGNTKFSNTFVEKKLGMVATTRNWATVNKVVTL